MSEYLAFTQRIAESGELIAGDPLQGIDTATAVRVRDGKTSSTDGPFAETKEVLGGYYLVDVPDLDRAIELAAQIPRCRLRHGRGAARPGDPRSVSDGGIEQLYREHAGQLLGSLVRTVRDLDLAEEALQEAIAIAIAEMASRGCRREPGGVAPHGGSPPRRSISCGVRFVVTRSSSSPGGDRARSSAAAWRSIRPTLWTIPTWTNSLTTNSG